MKVLIIGGTQAAGDAARLALAQAGINVQIDHVESIHLAISVSGGVVNDVASNVPMLVTLVDHDNEDYSPIQDGHAYSTDLKTLKINNGHS
jgi:hypothetical protein